MELWQAIVLSVVEGFSEFLPISSTGHLILASHLLNLAQTEFLKSFEVIIQLGAILPVLTLYWKRLLQGKKIWIPIALAFLPTAIVGLTLYKLIKDYLLSNVPVVLISLFIGGIALIVVEQFYKNKVHKIESIEQLTPRQAILVGLTQSISVIPGVSRAGATIVGGLLVGLNRKSAVEFSFILAIPTMFAATGLDLLKAEFRFTQNEWTLLAVGLLGSFLSALLIVKFFIKFIEKNNFIPFGIYRIILAIVFAVLLYS